MNAHFPVVNMRGYDYGNLFYATEYCTLLIFSRYATGRRFPPLADPNHYFRSIFLNQHHDFSIRTASRYRCQRRYSHYAGFRSFKGQAYQNFKLMNLRKFIWKTAIKKILNPYKDNLVGARFVFTFAGRKTGNLLSCGCYTKTIRKS